MASTVTSQTDCMCSCRKTCECEGEEEAILDEFLQLLLLLVRYDEFKLNY